jgi:hypothetical protein
MIALLAILGLAWCFGGGLVFLSSKSPIHEILACLMLSFGVVFFGLAGLIHAVRGLRLTAPGDASRSGSGFPTEQGLGRALGPAVAAAVLVAFLALTVWRPPTAARDPERGWHQSTTIDRHN